MFSSLIFPCASFSRHPYLRPHVPTSTRPDAVGMFSILFRLSRMSKNETVLLNIKDRGTKAL